MTPRNRMVVRPLRVAAACAALGIAVAAPAAARPGGQPQADAPATLQRTTFRFSNIPVRSALQFIAEQGGFNLVVSDAVEGTITLKLVDVTWEQALDTVLRLKGLGLHVEGGTRTVVPARDR